MASIRILHTKLYFTARGLFSLDRTVVFTVGVRQFYGYAGNILSVGGCFSYDLHHHISTIRETSGTLKGYLKGHSKSTIVHRIIHRSFLNV